MKNRLASIRNISVKETEWRDEKKLIMFSDAKHMSMYHILPHEGSEKLIINFVFHTTVCKQRTVTENVTKYSIRYRF